MSPLLKKKLNSFDSTFLSDYFSCLTFSLHQNLLKELCILDFSHLSLGLISTKFPPFHILQRLPLSTLSIASMLFSPIVIRLVFIILGTSGSFDIAHFKVFSSLDSKDHLYAYFSITLWLLLCFCKLFFIALPLNYRVTQDSVLLSLTPIYFLMRISWP